jgi:hypothetical protein
MKYKSRILVVLIAGLILAAAIQTDYAVHETFTYYHPDHSFRFFASVSFPATVAFVCSLYVAIRNPWGQRANSSDDGHRG